MIKPLIIGATGKIGTLLMRDLEAKKIPAVAMIRDKSRASEMMMQGINVAEGDLEKDFRNAFVDCNTVIFTAGSGAQTNANQTLLIDLWGACKAIDLSRELNIKQFIMVSSRGADNPDDGPIAIKPYLVAKHFADNYLMASGLNYTILRPGRLLDEDGTGLITTKRPLIAEQQIISRVDTARAIIHCLDNLSVRNKIYEIFKGENPIKDALI